MDEYLRGARRKARAAKDYFDDEEDVSNSSDGAHDKGNQQQNDGGDEDEVDPLDAFMMGIETQVVQEQQQQVQKSKPFEKPDVLNHGDDADGYLDEYAKNTKQSAGGTGFDDSDEEVYATAKRVDQGDNYDDGQQDAKKTMEVLAPVNHSQVAYESFHKCFYTPHADIQKMTAHEVDELRRELAVRTEGVDVPQPIRSFVHLGFDRKMLALLMKLGLEAPTAIQAQAFPVALSGRDMIGIAKTGSGKTLAFTLPMVRHVMDQRELRKDEGPIAIVLSPTRELAHQIFVQVKKFLNVYGAECAAIYGGVGKWEQIQAVRKGAEVVVATPGRLIEMIRKKTVKMNRVTFVVLDEADRMFEMGFEPQLRSIMGQIRPDRQTLMFSATFRRRIEALALDILDRPVKVMIGQIGQANEDIHQIAVVLPNDNAKWPWLMNNLKRIADEGRVLIFAGSKMGCETLTKNLNSMRFPSWCLHGDKSQQERSEALAKFKTGECRILVATDVASRGLDVKDVKTVVNFDVAKNIDIHVHRIGRTGRMGLEGFEPGTAYTLVTSKESQFAAQLVHNMDVIRIFCS
ncbi:Dead-box atp-dependent RNA helicase 24 [Globisporangium polare]